MSKRHTNRVTLKRSSWMNTDRVPQTNYEVYWLNEFEVVKMG